MIAVEDLRNVLVESVNAQDPELIGDVDVPNPSELEEIIEVINERFPRVMMTRGDLDNRPVAVVWMPDRNERYRRVAHVEILPEEGGPHTEFVEGADPAVLAEEPPGLTVAEWESTEQTDSGDANWT